MMDCVVPGGIATDIAEGGPQVILRALGDIASELPAIRRLHDAPALSSRLTGLGRVDRELAAALGAGGVVGRASGHAFDLRTVFAAGYQDIAPRLAVRADGDAAARQHLRTSGNRGKHPPDRCRVGHPAGRGRHRRSCPRSAARALAAPSSIRGDVWHWLRLDHGQIAAAFPRDPGWALWPLVERVLEHASADDIDLIRASFALPASGMDL